MLSTKGKILIIQGMTKQGRKFRPSDWTERMSGALSTFGKDHRIHYSPLLQPITINGIKCIAIDTTLEDMYPEVYRYIMNFTESNQLNVLTDVALIESLSPLVA